MYRRVYGAHGSVFWGSTETESSFSSFHVITLFLTVSFPESLHQSSLTKCHKLSLVIDSELISKPFNGRWDGTCDCLASPENLGKGLREA